MQFVGDIQVRDKMPVLVGLLPCQIDGLGIERAPGPKYGHQYGERIHREDGREEA